MCSGSSISWNRKTFARLHEIGWFSTAQPWQTLQTRVDRRSLCVCCGSGLAAGGGVEEEEEKEEEEEEEDEEIGLFIFNDTIEEPRRLRLRLRQGALAYDPVCMFGVLYCMIFLFLILLFCYIILIYIIIDLLLLLLYLLYYHHLSSLLLLLFYYYDCRAATNKIAVYIVCRVAWRSGRVSVQHAPSRAAYRLVIFHRPRP